MAVTSKNQVNYDIVQGDTWATQLEYGYQDGNDDETFYPIDITGMTFKLEVRDKPAGRILCAICTIGDGITVVDAVNGIVDVEISPEKTRNFVYPRSAYQIQSTDQYGAQDTWLQGWFKVNPGVIN
jgi:phage/plasmid primase-like uncharacterized protein